MITVDVQHASERGDLPSEATIRHWVESLFVPHDRGELTIRLVESPESQALNRQFRNVDKSTNVLSFPADWTLEGGDPYFGDIAICTDVVHRESGEQGKSFQAHLAHMVIHGVLHLLGYDHEQDGDAEIMEAREVEALSRLGFNHPYETNQDHHSKVRGTPE